MMDKINAVFERDGGLWVAFAEELPGANSQGATIEEARDNLKDAVRLILEVNQELARRETEGREVVREELDLAR